MTTQERLRFEDLSDRELLATIKQLASAERAATAQLIRCLAEIDARRLYLSQGCPSLFVYCTRVLHLSEHAAYGRMEAARAARKFPVVIDLLGEGAITLTTVTLLATHLTPENHTAILELARNKTKREVEELVARIRPLPDAPANLRKLPEPRQASSEAPQGTSEAPVARAAAPTSPLESPAPSSLRPQPQASAAVKPLSPERYKLQVTLKRQTYDKLQRARDLMRHTVPSGDLSEIVDRAVTALLKELERAKCGFVERPRVTPASVGRRRGRAIPSAVRRAVWGRDAGRCAFVGEEGRCGETGFLEFHHVLPFADGGQATVENIQLRCRAHNAYEAEQWFSVVRERAYVLGHALSGQLQPRSIPEDGIDSCPDVVRHPGFAPHA
jgi:hypothetical protein